MVWCVSKNRPLHVLAGWWLTAIAMAVLVLPSIGPLLDHHYVERLPGHAHTYPGDVLPAQVHSYEVPGHRDHSGASRDVLLQAGDILYMARDDGAAYAPGDAATKLDRAFATFPGLVRSNLFALLPLRNSRPENAFIPPPWTPPRPTVSSQ